MNIRIPVTVKKETYYPGGGRKRRAYTARAGALEAAAPTEKEAVGSLQALAERAITNEGSPVVMYDLIEPDKVWIAYGDAHGWHYSITRRIAPGSHYSTGSYNGTWDRETCLERMRAHWYQCNVEPIVDGICSLAGWSQWSCSRCGAAGPLTFRPTACGNPACRAPL